MVRLTGIAQRPELIYGDAAVEVKMSRASFALLVARIDRSFAPGLQPANAPRRPMAHRAQAM